MSTDGQMDKEDAVHIYSEILLSNKKQNETEPFAATPDGPRDYHTKSKTNVISLICGI